MLKGWNLEESRTPIGETGIIPSLVNVYKIGSENGDLDDELKVQALRALANLCFDDGKNVGTVIKFRTLH